MLPLFYFKSQLLQKENKMLHIFCTDGTKQGILLNPFGKCLLTLPLWSCHILRFLAVFSRSNMQSVFFTEFIGNGLEFIFPITIPALKLVSGYHIYTVYYDVGMEMFPVCMNSHHRLIFSCKCLPGKPHCNIIHNLRCTFTRF